MTCLVRNIKLDIVQCLADWYVRVVFIHFKCCYKNSRFCRPVNIDKSVTLGRLTGNQLLSTHGKITETLTIHFQCKLSSDLCRHEGMGNAIFFKVFLQSDEIQTDLLRNNM